MAQKTRKSKGEAEEAADRRNAKDPVKPRPGLDRYALVEGPWDDAAERWFEVMTGEWDPNHGL